VFYCGPVTTSFNFADLFELMVDAVPDRLALVAGEQKRTYAELEERANRLAHHLSSAGIAPGEHVGIYAYNGVEWVEGMLALYKIRAVPVNINYRYVEHELRYLFDNSDITALIFQREFAPRVAGVLDGLPLLRHLVMADDGTGADVSGLDVVDYEAVIAESSPARDFEPRTGDDIHLIYTGGTTGRPKGVLWRQEDIFFSLCGGIDAYTNERVQRPEQLVERVRGGAGPMVMYAVAPLMHGAGQVATIRCVIAGDTVVITPRFDAEEVWRISEREKVNILSITGDAMARPMADALERLHDQLDLSSVISVGSSAAIFSPVIKRQLMKLLPNALIIDSIGATETGMNGIKVASPDEAVDDSHSGPPTVTASADTIVIDDNYEPIEPGSGAVGRLARTGNIPLAYYKDPEKSAATFLEFEGKRYAIAGDYAKVEADGSIHLLGRGSSMINTGGEKVYPEEVEGVLKSHAGVFDALVVGVTDERWGERVAALVQPYEGKEPPTLDELRDHCRQSIAGYKIPRQLFVVEEIVRAPSGKPDYPWAKQFARNAAGAAGA
jgi:acyl-CoA synthetase (AMP-forming)/AMP-acid ligase II